jgi:hypothetical protein
MNQNERLLVQRHLKAGKSNSNNNNTPTASRDHDNRTTTIWPDWSAKSLASSRD